MNQNELKKQAAHAALEFVPDNQFIGVGSGSTVHYFIDALATIHTSGSVAFVPQAQLAERGRFAVKHGIAHSIYFAQIISHGKIKLLSHRVFHHNPCLRYLVAW